MHCRRCDWKMYSWTSFAKQKYTVTLPLNQYHSLLPFCEEHYTSVQNSEQVRAKIRSLLTWGRYGAKKWNGLRKHSFQYNITIVWNRPIIDYKHAILPSRNELLSLSLKFAWTEDISSYKSWRNNPVYEESTGSVGRRVYLWKGGLPDLMAGAGICEFWEQSLRYV